MPRKKSKRKSRKKQKAEIPGLDLTLLFGSLTRVKLLALFVKDYKQSYYVRELTRLLNLQINAIRRELKNLSTLGIIKIDDKANDDKDFKKLLDGKAVVKKKSRYDKKYYKINEEFLFVDELKGLFTKAQIMTKDNMFNNLEAEFPNLVYAVLLGKFVNDSESKIDLLLVGSASQRKLKRFVKSLEKSIGAEINYALFTEDEFAYRQKVVDKFLYKILENNKIELIDKRSNNLFNKMNNELITAGEK